MTKNLAPPPERLAWLTCCVLGIQAILGLVALLSGVYEYQLLESFDKDRFDDLIKTVREIEASDRHQVMIGFLQFISFSFSALLLGIWFSKISSYTRLAAQDKVRFSPLVCSLSWFIPVAQAILPFLCLRESWQLLSSSEGKITRLGHWLIGLWWLCFLAFLSFKYMSIEASEIAEDIQALLEANSISQASDALGIVLAVVSIFVILLFQRHLPPTEV